MKKNETYYFGKQRGKLMKKMRRRELYARLGDAYQLAGSMLIGSAIHDTVYDEDGNATPGRLVNGWTQREVDDAVEALLNFLACPAEVSEAQFDKARAVWRAEPRVQSPHD